MEPNSQPQPPEPALPHPALDDETRPLPSPPVDDVVPYHGLLWIFVGSQGLRAGWSASIFVLLTYIFLLMLGSVLTRIVRAMHAKLSHMSPASTILQEGLFFLALLAAAAIVAAIERRRILDYNFTGPRRMLHFSSGLIAGFAALSILVGAMAWGGWLHFGPVALSGAQIFQFAALWACGFLLVGLCEEGSFRGFLQFTFTRGLNFWWALGIESVFCLIGFINPKVNGAIGVYAIALLGVVPCLLLHLQKAPGAGFWQAAWVTSTAFGFIHTGNSGENWIGIFAAAFIGFVFCVSIRLTGSAWWAIGCHASWDWAETYFYGTADSGFAAQGHLLSTAPAGNQLWSGGANGPEGSLLVLPVLLLLLVALVVLYGRGKTAPLAAPATEQATG